MLEASFEIFDHTADAGIRVNAPSMKELIRPAGEGLYAVIGELAPDRDHQPLTISLIDVNAAQLLREYLSELLNLFERGHRMVTSVEVTAFDDRQLSVTGRTSGVDEQKSVYFREVKAITYHELSIRPIAGGYEATIIVDI